MGRERGRVAVSSGRGENLHPRRDEVKETERRRPPPSFLPCTTDRGEELESDYFGEMTLGPRARSEEGPTTICIPATTWMLEEREGGREVEKREGFSTTPVECSTPH